MRIRPVETSGLPIPFQRRGQGPVIVGSPDPLAWANKADGAKHAWDFIANAARWNGQYIGALANTPNWTFTRASTGYAQTSGGVLQSFASGELRRTDKGVLIEGAMTNLCLQSQTFDNATWGKGGLVTVTADATTAPDGTTTADKIVEIAAASTPRIAQNPITISSGAAYTFSCFVKAAERTQCRFVMEGSASFSAYFDVGAGTVGAVGGSATASITAYANGWYRCSVTWTSGSTNANPYIATAEAGATIASGDNTKGIYLWGAQLEAAAFPSSYIPTTTASATRAADSLTVTGVSGLDYPLTLYAELERASDSGTNAGVFEVNNGTTTDRALLNINSSDLMQVYARTSSVDQVNATIAGALAIGTVYKTAARISTNDSRHALGGTLGTQDTSCTNPATPTKIIFGDQNAGASDLYGYLRRLAIFSRALSDGELQALTT